MNKAFSLEKFILASSDHQLSRSDYKRVMLTGYLAIISIFVSVVYTFLDVSSHIYYSLLSYFDLFIVAVLVLVAIRLKKYSLAKVLLMANSNLIVFYAALNDPPTTGVCMLFIPAGTGSFAIFGFHERFKSIVIALFSVGLFILAFFGDFQIPRNPPTETYIITSYILNFSISLTIVVAVLFFLGSLNESSEKELMEKEKVGREKNDQLIKINGELDRFIYSVSHDLRSPLSSIQGLVALGKISTDEQEMKKCFTLIDERIKAQEFFINEIIEIYRNNRVDMVPEPIGLKKLVENIVEEISFTPDANSIQFKIEINETMEVVADKIRLKSILHNLIGNAIKYHDPAKADRFIKIAASTKDASTHISVEDNGKGIDAEHLPKIFDMFYRASTDSKGSGLGLYIVKEIATKMNGSISAESEITKGTKFTLRLQ